MIVKGALPEVKPGDHVEHQTHPAPQNKLALRGRFSTELEPLPPEQRQPLHSNREGSRLASFGLSSYLPNSVLSSDFSFFFAACILANTVPIGAPIIFAISLNGSSP